MSKLELFREAVRKRDEDNALSFADDILDVMGREAPTEVFDFIDEVAEDSQVGALLCARSLSLRHPEKRKRRLRLLRIASKGEDEELAGLAHYMLAAEHLAAGKIDKVLPNLEKAAQLGHGASHVRISHAYETGEYDNEINLEYALDILALAVEDHDYGPAKVALADFILRNHLDNTDFDIPALLHDALHDGVPGAAERLMAVMMAELDEEEEREGDGGERPDLANVVPDGMKRIVAARDALLNEYHAEPVMAETMVANLHGFPDWETLVEAARDPDIKKGAFDEDCDAEELALRRKAQLAVVHDFMRCTDPVAILLLDLLSPTKRTGTPSLRRLDELKGDLPKKRSPGRTVRRRADKKFDGDGTSD